MRPRNDILLSDANNSQNQYASLFQFIKNHTEIHTFISQLSLETPEVKELQAVLVKSDFYGPEFENDNVDFYILFLMKENKIDFWQGVTILAYITACRQYDTNFEVIPGDTKKQAQVNVNSFSYDGEAFTKEGNSYLRDLAIALKYFNIDLDIEKARTFILSLPCSERALFKIGNLDKNESGLLLRSAANLPLVYPKWKMDQEWDPEVYIPSFSILNYLLKVVSNDPITILPAYGRLSPESLSRLHKNGIHHFPLTSIKVKSNLISAHDATGAFDTCIHDLTHVFMGSLLRKVERDFLFNRFIPILNEWQKMANEHGDEKFYHFSKEFISHCEDLDLSPIQAMTDPDTRFGNYLVKCLDRVSHSENFINQLIALTLHSYGKGEWQNEEKIVWLKIIYHLLSHFSGKCDAELTHALLFSCNFTLTAFTLNNSELKLIGEKNKENYLKINKIANDMDGSQARNILDKAAIPDYYKKLLLDSPNIVVDDSSNDDEISNYIPVFFSYATNQNKKMENSYSSQGSVYGSLCKKKQG